MSTLTAIGIVQVLAGILGVALAWRLPTNVSTPALFAFSAGVLVTGAIGIATDSTQISAITGSASLLPGTLLIFVALRRQLQKARADN